VTETEALSRVEMVHYDASWAERFADERTCILRVAGTEILELEHIGSTAVPGLWAKPIIDLMAAVTTLDQGRALVEPLTELGYQLIDTGMADRLFFQRRAEGGLAFQLHIVERETWDERHERLMRDYLLVQPQAAAAYSDLKIRLAREYATDSLGYTKAKTTFIWDLVDKARAKLGLPSVDVWPE
jgi:GrpB-like predicted nucleotidyltransferase (UPF0157 family)